jgi:hypothetical protein
MLEPMHILLSGFKALWTHISYEGVKTIRECCGAIGFSLYSGLSTQIDSLSFYVTGEGDNVVMNMQAA